MCYVLVVHCSNWVSNDTQHQREIRKTEKKKHRVLASSPISLQSSAAKAYDSTQ